MKKLLFTFVAIVLLSPSVHAQQREDSCAVKMERFYSHEGLLQDDKLRKDIQLCRAHCDKMANYQKIRDMCGIEDCKYMAADGNLNPWCCDLAKYWSDKQGSRSNPLEGITDMCRKQGLFKTNFIECTTSLRNGAMPGKSCCSSLSDIKKYDPIMAKDLRRYCKKLKAKME